MLVLQLEACLWRFHVHVGETVLGRFPGECFFSPSMIRSVGFRLVSICASYMTLVPNEGALAPATFHHCKGFA